MPEGKCRICGYKIKAPFKEYMAKFRRHYRDNHPKAWRAAIRRGVAKRKRK